MGPDTFTSDTHDSNSRPKNHYDLITDAWHGREWYSRRRPIDELPKRGKYFKVRSSVLSVCGKKQINLFDEFIRNVYLFSV
jgi:hypothetical protein